MRAICSWCEAEGEPGYLGEREPLESPEETHGVCQRHLAQMLTAPRAPSSGAPQLLIVVDSGDRSLFEYLKRGLAEVGGVHVLVDRRNGERRQGPRSVSLDRRQADRRQRRGVVHSMGCTFVRFYPTSDAC